MKRILVPIDFSQHSLTALEYAIDLGAPTGATITVLHVLEPVAYSTPADLYAGMATQLGNLLAEQRRSARQQLDKIVERYGKKGVTLTVLLRDGVAYREIVDAATKGKADLIVQATHGRTGLSHILLGSVAERVVRTAECPVLTVRSGTTSASKSFSKRSSKQAAAEDAPRAAAATKKPARKKLAAKKPPSAKRPAAKKKR